MESVWPCEQTKGVTKSSVGNPPQRNNRRIVESRVFFGVRSQDNNRSNFFGVRPQAITGKARQEIYSLQSLQGCSLSGESPTAQQ
jgi:hypothetical protein